MVQDERKQIFPERMVSFILVNNSILRGQLQYTDYLIYTNNSDDVNTETLQSSEKGHKSFKERSNLKSVIRCICFLKICANSPLGESSHTYFEKQTNKLFLSMKNKTKISLEMVRHENDVHN